MLKTKVHKLIELVFELSHEKQVLEARNKEILDKIKGIRNSSVLLKYNYTDSATGELKEKEELIANELIELYIDNLNKERLSLQKKINENKKNIEAVGSLEVNDAALNSVIDTVTIDLLKRAGLVK